MHHPYGTTHFFSWMERTERQDVSDEITQVYIELSTHCNLNCRTCVRNSIEDFRPRHFTRPMMKRLLPMLKNLPKLQRIVLLGFGEAFCNPDFTRHLLSLRECGAEIVLVSNAHFIDDASARFIVSLPVNELWLSWDDNPDSEIFNRRGTDAGSFASKAEMLRSARESAGSSLPLLGMEIVVMKSNYEFIHSIVAFGINAGIEIIIISNVFPYSEAMKDEIIYTISGEPEKNQGKVFKKIPLGIPVTIAGMRADVLRSCPFIERGTVFITAGGNIAPCPELAYTHPAWYFGLRRMHRTLTFGTIENSRLDSIWTSSDFKEFRRNFEYYDFPDCSSCHQPDMCWHRTVDLKDCYRNPSPCGECLWAKGIVLCP